MTRQRAREGKGVDMGEKYKKEKAHEGEKNRDGQMKGRQIQVKGARGGNRRAPTSADVLCTPVKWPMQIERHRRTVGVHVTVNEPISTSFLLFNAFSKRVPSRHRMRIDFDFRGREDSEHQTFFLYVKLISFSHTEPRQSLTKKKHEEKFNTIIILIYSIK